MNAGFIFSDDNFRGLQANQKWFAVFTVPRHEKRVQEHLCARDVEISCHCLGCNGVVSIVSGGRESAAVSESYIEFLQEGLRHGRIEAHPYLTTGTRVRIRSGLLVGLEGILLHQKNSFRVMLTLEMIMRSIRVEVQMEDIEPVNPVLWQFVSDCSCSVMLMYRLPEKGSAKCSAWNQ
jgi:transcription antitermination factor NusG